MKLGLAVPAAAFVVFTFATVALTEVRCDTGAIDLHLLVAIVTVGAVALALAGLAASIVAFRRTRHKDPDPPESRIHFMSIMGMMVAPIITVIVVMAGIGVLVLPACAQAGERAIVRPERDTSSSARELGAQLFAANCATCHGSRGGGRPDRGPGLRGVGAQAADFYLTTGYMPLRTPTDQPVRSRPSFASPELRAITAYVASLGHGPGVPRPALDGSVSRGLEAFTNHCAGCHQIVGEGGVVTGAKVPPLDDATPAQIAEAIRIGPYVMPRFSARAISDDEVEDIIAYVRYAQHPRDAGGWSLDHLGPFPEGMVAGLLAMGALIATCAVVGRRRRA